MLNKLLQTFAVQKFSQPKSIITKFQLRSHH